ncbi:MAG TPA: hypothetical protein VFQ84_05095 [Arenimonas sp.]|uniref:hypothetical protein n=1 Tax=Arenimonas sp. TaxID=1872635 RepID=UPI002D7F6DFF|nr:hypothetical protein [Arenimonas sp.]HEU0152704.1 hypothetical protein [Arenimonas sp.]
MRVRTLAPLISLSLALATGPAMAQQNVDKVFGGITAQAGQKYGSLDTVNGGITIREGAEVESAETVNGGISIDDKARVGSAETVNGGISLGEQATAGSVEAVNGGIQLARGARVERDIEAVNGGIKVAAQAEVGGDVGNVNGAITLAGARVGGDVTTTNGDIVLSDGARIDGGILVEKPSSSWFNSGDKRVPRIVIGADSVVGGSLVFEHEVELFVHPTAKIGPVTGATPRAFTDTLPARD